MGWFGYGIYDGDGTQSWHIDFIKMALPFLTEDNIIDFLKFRGTKIPSNLLPYFKKGIPCILKKNRVPKHWNDDTAIKWQMLLSLILDNNLMVPNKISKYGLLASYYLLGEHAENFDKPSKRRAAIKRFIKRARESCSMKAWIEVNRILKI